MKEFLTETDKKIASYIEQNISTVLSSSIHDLANLIGVSSSSISKYIKKIGYSSYSRFKVVLAQQNAQPIDAQLNSHDTIKTIQSKLFHTITRSYEMTLELLNDELLETIVQQIHSSRRIYMFGVGASGMVCNDLYFKLSRIGKNIIYHTDPHIQLASLSGATNQDFIIGISYSSNTKEVITAFKIAKELSIPTLSITGIGNQQLDTLSTYQLKIPRHENTIRSSAITSRNDSFFLIDILYLALLQKEEDRHFQNLEKSYRMTHSLRED